MKILSISDIHNNLASVLKLRDLEENCYDLVLVAGDAGSEASDLIFKCLNSFDCPVFNVFGNWDNTLDYNFDSSDYNLVHHNTFSVGGLYISGISGCPTHWGKNPIAQVLRTELNAHHEAVLDQMENERELSSAIRVKNEREAQILLEELAEKTKDKRRKTYRNKIKRINELLRKKNDQARNGFSRILRSKEYRQYQSDAQRTGKEILVKNRAQLFSLIRSEGIDPSKLILLSHDRLTRINEELGDLLLHVFGHRHTFKHTTFKGTHYLNTSQLDGRIPVYFKDQIEEHKRSDDFWRFVMQNPFYSYSGKYGVIELSKHGKISTIQEKTLLPDDEDYECIREYVPFWNSNDEYMPPDDSYFDCARKMKTVHNQGMSPADFIDTYEDMMAEFYDAKDEELETENK